MRKMMASCACEWTVEAHFLALRRKSLIAAFIMVCLTALTCWLQWVSVASHDSGITFPFNTLRQPAHWCHSLSGVGGDVVKRLRACTTVVKMLEAESSSGPSSVRKVLGL